MAKSEVAVPNAGHMFLARNGENAEIREFNARKAMELVPVDGCPREVPRFFLEVPWQTDSDAIVDDMITHMFLAENPDSRDDDGASRKLAGLVGERVVIRAIAARPSTAENGWGAYLALDVADASGEVIGMVSCSAKQAVARIARAFVEQGLPIVGTFFQIAAKSGSRSAPIGFSVEQAL